MYEMLKRVGAVISVPTLLFLLGGFQFICARAQFGISDFIVPGFVGAYCAGLVANHIFLLGLLPYGFVVVVAFYLAMVMKFSGVDGGIASGILWGCASLISILGVCAMWAAGAKRWRCYRITFSVAIQLIPFVAWFLSFRYSL
jgi:hypothetical protein